MLGKDSRVKSGGRKKRKLEYEIFFAHLSAANDYKFVKRHTSRHPHSLVCYCASLVLEIADGRIPPGSSRVSSNIFVRTVACLSHDSTSKSMSCIHFFLKPVIFSQPSWEYGQRKNMVNYPMPYSIVVTNMVQWAVKTICCPWPWQLLHMSTVLWTWEHNEKSRDIHMVLATWCSLGIVFSREVMMSGYLS